MNIQTDNGAIQQNIIDKRRFLAGTESNEGIQRPEPSEFDGPSSNLVYLAGKISANEGSQIVRILPEVEKRTESGSVVFQELLFQGNLDALLYSLNALENAQKNEEIGAVHFLVERDRRSKKYYLQMRVHLIKSMNHE